MTPIINKIYSLSSNVFNLDGISKNSRILLLPDGVNFMLMSGKIQAMIENNKTYEGKGRVITKTEAKQEFPDSFEITNDKLTDENVVSVLMPSKMFDFCKKHDQSPANYIRGLISKEMEKE